MNYDSSRIVAYLQAALRAHAQDVQFLFNAINLQINELEELIKQLNMIPGVTVSIENGVLQSHLSLYAAQDANLVNRVNSLDSMVGRIQGHFADMIRSIAAMMQLIKRIQNYSPEFSYNLFQLFANINNLITNSLTLYTMQDYHDLLKETQDELSSDSSPRDYYNLHDDISSREDWFCKRLHHRYAHVYEGTYGSEGEPSSCGINIGVNGTHNWYESQQPITGEHSCCFCNQDYTDSEPRIRCDMCKCTLHTKCYSDLHRK